MFLFVEVLNRRILESVVLTSLRATSCLHVPNYSDSLTALGGPMKRMYFTTCR